MNQYRTKFKIIENEVWNELILNSRAEEWNYRIENTFMVALTYMVCQIHINVYIRLWIETVILIAKRHRNLHGNAVNKYTVTRERYENENERVIKVSILHTKESKRNVCSKTTSSFWIYRNANWFLSSLSRKWLYYFFRRIRLPTFYLVNLSGKLTHWSEADRKLFFAWIAEQPDYFN